MPTKTEVRIMRQILLRPIWALFLESKKVAKEYPVPRKTKEKDLFVIYLLILTRQYKQYRAFKLFNIRLYATLCFNYFRWHRRMFSYGSVFELL